MWPKFKTQEEIPEAFRDFYEQKGDEWVAKLPDEGALREEGRRAIEAERAERKKAEDRAKDLDRRVKDLEAKVEAAKVGVDDEDPEVKKWKDGVYKEIRDEVAAELAEIEKRAETAEGKARSLLLDSRVKALALKNGVLPERVDDWWALNSGRFDLDDSEEPIVKDGKGKAIKEYISGDLKKERPYLYEGTKGGGGGAGGDHSGPGGLKHGTSAEDILKNPGAALSAARDQGDAA